MAGTLRTRIEGERTTANVYQKLAAARRLVAESGITKSGVNARGGWTYLELADIVPAQSRAFAQVGLIEQFTYRVDADEDGHGTSAYAVSRVINVERPDEVIEFRLPWPEETTDSADEIASVVQLTGSWQTYLRRYLKMQVLDLAVPDEVDAQPGTRRTGPQDGPRPRATHPPRGSAATPPATTHVEVARAIAGAEHPAEPLQVRNLARRATALWEAHADHPEADALVGEVEAATDGATLTRSKATELMRRMGELERRLASTQDA